MQKKLFTQIRNEWRGNLWLALELLVVSVVLWYIIDMLYCSLATYNEPRGFDTGHCYLIEMGVLTDKSPDYKSDADWHDDILTLAERLRHRPEVEAVSLSQNSYPYNGSNSTDPVQYDTLRSPGWTIRRLVTPDFVCVPLPGCARRDARTTGRDAAQRRVSGFGQPLQKVWHPYDFTGGKGLPPLRRHDVQLPPGRRLAEREVQRLSAGQVQLQLRV